MRRSMIAEQLALGLSIVCTGLGIAVLIVALCELTKVPG